ncbi:hypothetical protein EC957_007075 [Mortierella hygrophila]|uniref:Uncharacterized protein n=1 Tax=Mortierella hygrophila TaxID=979708 RepID=A0A9P6JY99_9FUNG|nr:hypothetical protein EC957_007075 [Mortierella hygrophila]
MAMQGTLNLDCIAADPYSRYLYGVASANDGSSTNNYGYTESTIVLVRSNASPTNLATLTWEVFAHTNNSKELSYSYPTFTSVDCAANDDGEVTVFFRSPYRTTSPATLLPMGFIYSPVSDTWTTIRGPSMYGWTSDRLIHRSYYINSTYGNALHFLTSDVGHQLTIAGVEYETNILWPNSFFELREGVRAFIKPETVDFGWIYDSFDYSRQGFFSTNKGRSTRFMTYHRGTFFLSGTFPQNDSCPVILTASVGTRLGEPCAYQGVSDRGTYMAQHYVFGGDRNGMAFFGGVFEVDDVFKIYTTEKQEGRKYFEHIIIRNDNSSSFSVDQNWQVVGGLIDGQEPFVVALTSVGLYQFTIFGQAAGTLEGPYKVRILNNLNSLSPRVVSKLRNKIQGLDNAVELEQQQEQSRMIIGGVVGVVVIMAALVIGCSLCRHARRKKQFRKNEKEKRGRHLKSMELPSFVGKHEVHSMGIIPEDECIPDDASFRTVDIPSASKRPRMEARLPNYTS